MKKVFKNIFESFLWIGALLLIVDFVTKQIVLHTMYVGDEIVIIKNFFSINYVINNGMAFGLNFDITEANTDQAALTNRIIFVIISLIGAGILSYVYYRSYKKANGWYRASLGLMLSGCLGNLIDRAFYSKDYLGHGALTSGVVDFLGFDFGSYSFPRFNIADACLVVGTIILILLLVIEEMQDGIKKHREELAKEESEEQ